MQVALYRVGMGVLLLVWPLAAAAQGLIDQEEVAAVLEGHATALDAIPAVYYEYYVFGREEMNAVRARHRLYEHLGEGDLAWGQMRARTVVLLNRTTLDELTVGDTLVVPTRFEVDFRAYAPFPRYYPGGRGQRKLLVLDKGVQAWGAYERGRLVRWGIINTGALDTPTPNGRFNVNWKEEERVSSESPDDEDWTMYWVMNLHDGRGIHLHQYAMPSGGPTSHGCVRLVDSDAQWLYTWTDAWETTAGGTGVASRRGRLLRQGTMVLVIGEAPTGRPRPFRFKARYPVLRRLTLPARPCDVPPGSPQQQRLGCPGRSADEPGDP